VVAVVVRRHHYAGTACGSRVDSAGGGRRGGCSGGWSRWSYVAIARRDARRRTGRCMAMLTQPEELNCESSGCSMHKVSIRELGVAAAAAAGAAGPLPWELGASGDGGCTLTLVYRLVTRCLTRSSVSSRNTLFESLSV
jgi:hypothetical protein